MKIVGIHIDGRRLGVTVVQRQFGRTELLDSFAGSFSTDEELVAALRTRAAGWAGSRIVSALPGSRFTQRTIAFPFSDRKRIEKALPFELEDLLPFSLDEVVLDHAVLKAGSGKQDETQVLCLALPKAALRQHLDRLAAAGIEPHAVVPSFLGLSAVAALMPADGPLLLMAGGDLCLRGAGMVQAVRSIGASATGGLRHVLQSLEAGREDRIERAALLGSDEAAQQALAAAEIAVETVSPALGGKEAADAVSLGAALTTDVNFRKGEFAFRKADEGARRRRRTMIIAAAAAAVLFCVNIGVKLWIVRAGYNRLDGEIRQIYQQTFPDSKPTGDVVRQMKDRLADARKRFGALGSGTSALDVMKTVTDGIPKEVRISFTDFLLEGERLRLQGEAPSFETLDKAKAELQKSPLFSEVAVQDTRMGVDNKVKFRLDIRLKQAM